MAPTTLEGMKTSTTPYGRRIDLNGYPLNITKLVAELDGTCYVTRQAVHTPAAVRKTKAAIKQAFKNSMEGRGTSLVEIVSTCNSGWKMSPVASNKWMEEHMFAKYPLGEIKNTVKE
jgi:2-oxoglutarate ferredoxin oxidoreductase subunit beta